ncbi:cupredoxin domain-containing protein [Methanobacterium oryzae]|uniref:cupredoxin domain-containing protein n=1 Tax=Methanobacterium oryzae TaxID=69540 RepID=UPI003D259A36
MKDSQKLDTLIVVILVALMAILGHFGILSLTFDNSIQSSGFNHTALSIDTGDKVNWINHDNKTHRIVSDYGFFDSGNLAPGQNYSYEFRKTGQFPYHCAINSSMKGTIYVTTVGMY